MVNQAHFVRGLLSVRVLLGYKRLLELELLKHFVDSRHLLQHLLVVHLLLWLRILHIIAMCLSQYTCLYLQLFPLLLKPLLMIVGYQHPRLSPLLVEELPDRALDLDGCQVLSSHGSGPGLLDDALNKNDKGKMTTYTLTEFVLLLVVWDDPNLVTLVDARSSANHGADGS